jgi:motility quorum-sensing regulator/GCU-specific mRNA interferase toxin
MFMEKRKPHNILTDIKAIVAKIGKLAFTHTAQINSAAMGLTGDEPIDVIFSLSRSMFYKSMTTIHDATLWQDVYHALPERQNCLHQGHPARRCGGYSV